MSLSSSDEGAVRHEAIPYSLRIIKTLTSAHNYAQWASDIKTHLVSCNAVESLEGHPEPYRIALGDCDMLGYEVDIVRPPGEYAGYAPPHGYAIPHESTKGSPSPETVLTATQRAQWDKWAGKERLARTSILQTVDYEYRRELGKLWSARDMLNWLDSVCAPKSATRRRELTAKLVSTHLLSSQAEHCEAHVKSFVATIYALEDIGYPVSDADKVANFIASLEGVMEVYTPVQLKINSLPERDREVWGSVRAIFSEFIEKRRALDATNPLGALRPQYHNGPPAHKTNATARGPSNPRDRPARAAYDGNKFCTHHNRAGHTDEECEDKKSGRPPNRPPPRQRRIGNGGNSNDRRQQPTPQNALGALDASGPPSVVDLPCRTTHHAGFSLASLHKDEDDTTMSDRLFIDSGAGAHLVGNATLLRNVRPASMKFRLARSRHYLHAHAVGSIQLGSSADNLVNNVYVSNETLDNYLSETLLKKDGWRIDLENDTMSKNGQCLPLRRDSVCQRPAIVPTDGYTNITPAPAAALHQDPATSTTLPQIAPLDLAVTSPGNNSNPHNVDLPGAEPEPQRPSGPINVLERLAIAPVPANVTANPELVKLHHRLGHVGKPVLIQLARAGRLAGWKASDIESDVFNQDYCDACLAAKSTRKPGPGASPRGSADGEYIHVDIKGPLTTSRRLNRFWLIIVADHINLRIAVPVRTKDSAFEELRRWIRLLERQFGIVIKIVRSDGGGEFENHKLDALFAELGIIHQTTCPDDPSRNGLAERGNRTVIEMLKAISAHANVPPDLWDYGVEYTNMLLNVTCPTGDDGKTPWERLTGRRVNIEAIRPYGEVVYARHTDSYVDPIAKQIDTRPRAPRVLPTTPRAFRGRILGVDMATSGWIVLLDITEKVIYSRDIRTALAHGLGEPLPNIDQLPPTAIPTVINIPERDITPLPADVSTAIAAMTLVSVTSTTAIALNESFLDLDDAVQLPLASLAALETYDDDPITLQEALHSPYAEQWQAAINAELRQLENTGTWTPATLPKGRKAISAKWVFRTKRDAAGNIAKHKARLVARGFSQVPGVDYDATFAPVSRLTTVRVFLVYAIKNNMHIHAADVEGAYLNGSLDEEIYMTPPAGVTLPPNFNTYRLHKSLYGLKQGARQWWTLFSQRVKAQGWKQMYSDTCLFMRPATDTHSAQAFVLYVDDLLFATSTEAESLAIIEEMRADWRVTDLGEPSQLLGIALNLNRGTSPNVSLRQTAYIEELASRYGVTTARAGKYAPLPVGKNGLYDPVSPPADAVMTKALPSIVGSLIWVGRTCRPDISFAAGALARFISEPTVRHHELALRVVSHLLATKDVTLKLAPDPEAPTLEAYADADWAGCGTTRRSSSGYAVYYQGALVSWCSRRQATVAASTMEAEYVALAAATREVLWLRLLLKELGENIDNNPTTILCDNHAARRIAENATLHDRAKHIDIAHHLVRERVDSKEVAVKAIKSVDQRADIFTKALPSPAHNRNARLLNLTTGI